MDDAYAQLRRHDKALPPRPLLVGMHKRSEAWYKI